ncbi:MAG TPA: cupin domain-containing protein [bacterium]|nr:cupin domain-containing protein [bacterium]
MSRWWETLRAFPFAPAAGLALLGTALALVLRSGQGPPVHPVVYDPAAAVAPNPHPGLLSQPIGSLPGASVHHLSTTTGVNPHVHRTHDETVVILSGSGRMRVGDEARDISPGLTLVIPRGTVHSLEVFQGTVEAVSIFTPPFDGKDRHFLTAPAAAIAK